MRALLIRFSSTRSIRSALALPANATPSIVATVPAQHMYGIELSILMPLLGLKMIMGRDVMS